MGRRTPLYDAHRALGARLVEFGGWDMPLAYAGPTEEHRAVRTRCCLFDVSHIGEIEIAGPGARAFCQRLTTNDVDRLAVGDAQYTLICNERGGIIDDLILYRLAPDRYLAIVNAAHTAIVSAWMTRQVAHGVRVADVSEAWALLAVQGPRGTAVAARSVGVDPAQRGFTITEHDAWGVRVLASRTGYTGEDGFEILVPAEQAPAAWEDLLAGVAKEGGLPAGLAARDTLRLEAALPLCGTDMGTETTPWEASLGWVVALEAGGDFVGRDRLLAQRREGVGHRLACLELLEDAGVPRHGFSVRHEGVMVGSVTSGTKSPTLGRFIALASVERACTMPGTDLTVDVRGRSVPARVVPRPFYRRAETGRDG
jgi:aminomethyltransferase